MVPVAHGNDGMGSIRIPAACCGLVGIKPGLGSRCRPTLGNGSWFDMAENGPLTTTVADAALLLSVMAGRARAGRRAALRLGGAAARRTLGQGTRTVHAGRPALRRGRPRDR